MKLQELKCVPCEGGISPLSQQEAEVLHSQVPDWTLKENAIERTLRFRDFKEAMKFVNQVAETAENEGHHPDIYISYNRVRLELTTHKIKGLSNNDFILASKIDALMNIAAGV